MGDLAQWGQNCLYLPHIWSQNKQKLLPCICVCQMASVNPHMAARIYRMYSSSGCGLQVIRVTRITMSTQAPGGWMVLLSKTIQRYMQDKYHIQDNFLSYHSLLSAIPNNMKNNLMLVNNPRTNLTDLKSTNVYWDFIANIKDEPTCIRKWTQNGMSFRENNWKSILTLPFQLRLEPKLLEFQLKIIHGVYPTDSYVSKFDQNTEAKCSYCLEKNYIPHWFVSCKMLEVVLEQNWEFSTSSFFQCDFNCHWKTLFLDVLTKMLSQLIYIVYMQNGLYTNVGRRKINRIMSMFHMMGS